MLVGELNICPTYHSKSNPFVPPLKPIHPPYNPLWWIELHCQGILYLCNFSTLLLFLDKWWIIPVQENARSIRVKQTKNQSTEEMKIIWINLASLHMLHLWKPLAQGRMVVQGRGSPCYPKKKYFSEWVGIFLYLATPNDIYLATPSLILSEMIFSIFI